MAFHLRNTSIGLKVALAPALALAGLVIVAMIGWLGNQRLAADMTHIAGQGVDQLVAAQTLAQRVTELHQTLYQSLTWEAIGQRAERIKALDDGLQKRLAELSGALDRAAAEGPPEQRAAMTALAKHFKVYAKSAIDTLDMKSAGVANAANFVSTLDEQYKAAQALVAGIVKQQIDAAHDVTEQAQVGMRQKAWLMAGVALAALALCASLAHVFVRAITRPLGRAAALADALAEGDLTARDDEAGTDATGRVLRALDTVARNLAGLVSDIRGSAEQIATASSEISSGNTDLSARTEGAATALQQAAASIEQLAATIRNSAENAHAANTLAHDASSVAREGGALVGEVVQTMDGINTQAKKIADIIGTIDGLAFQTNILALNAAVEAARAGEQGRGFAVVAAEVRSLARRSAESAREIRALISTSVEQIGAGATKAQAAGQTMARIVGAIERVSQTVDDITRAATEQASGIALVSQSVAEMDRSTQQNAAMVEQAAAATESLNDQARHLVELLTRFRTA